jgi:hypothetical protein
MAAWMLGEIIDDLIRRVGRSLHEDNWWLSLAIKETEKAASGNNPEVGERVVLAKAIH